MAYFKNRKETALRKIEFGNPEEKKDGFYVEVSPKVKQILEHTAAMKNTDINTYLSRMVTELAHLGRLM